MLIVLEGIVRVQSEPSIVSPRPVRKLLRLHRGSVLSCCESAIDHGGERHREQRVLKSYSEGGLLAVRTKVASVCVVAANRQLPLVLSGPDLVDLVAPVDLELDCAKILTQNLDVWLCLIDQSQHRSNVSIYVTVVFAVQNTP